MPRGSAPGERRGGRQKGTQNKLTIARKTLADGAIGDGKTPLEVMLSNMRHFDNLAESAERVLAEMTAETIAELPADKQFERLLAEVKKAAGFRDSAQGCARDAAPYIHPRLTAISAPDGGPIKVERIERLIVESPQNPDSEDIRASAGTSEV